MPAGTSDSIKRFNFDYSYWSHDVCIMKFPIVFLYIYFDCQNRYGAYASMFPMYSSVENSTNTTSTINLEASVIERDDNNNIFVPFAPRFTVVS